MRRAINRRALLWGAGATAAVSLTRPTSAGGPQADPAVAHMKAVAADLFAAQNEGTVEAFHRAISRHADGPAIALYALGRYEPVLPVADRARYYQGVTTFMSRYFADQTRKYRVAKAEFNDDTMKDGKDTLVFTKLTLLTGAVYRVVWRLTPRGASFKVSDVKVLGFSLSYLQRRLFLAYLSRKKGDVQALVAALNRTQ
jgi:ABC-type transporter MlaC component